MRAGGRNVVKVVGVRLLLYGPMSVLSFIGIFRTEVDIEDFVYYQFRYKNITMLDFVT